MSGKLVGEVRKHAPALDPRALLLLMLIAERAQDVDHVERGKPIRARECYIDRDDLAARLKVSLRGLRSVVRRLQAQGLDPRVPMGRDSLGRTIVAAKGHVTVWRVPTFLTAPNGESGEHPFRDLRESGEHPYGDKGEPGERTKVSSGSAQRGVPRTPPVRNKPERTVPPPLSCTSPGAVAENGKGEGSRLEDQMRDELAALAVDSHGVSEDDGQAIAADAIRRTREDPETKFVLARLRAPAYREIVLKSCLDAHRARCAHEQAFAALADFAGRSPTHAQALDQARHTVPDTNPHHLLREAIQQLAEAKSA